MAEKINDENKEVKNNEKETENKEIKSAVDILLDKDDDQNLFLYNEKNDMIEFEQIAVVPLDSKIYAILRPADYMEGIEPDEAVVFVLVEKEDDDYLEVEENDEIIDKVFDVYYKMLEDLDNK